MSADLSDLPLPYSAIYADAREIAAEMIAINTSGRDTSISDPLRDYVNTKLEEVGVKVSIKADEHGYKSLVAVHNAGENKTDKDTFLIRGNDEYFRRCWYLLRPSKAKRPLLEAALRNGQSFDISQYGPLLDSGIGAPPAELAQLYS